MTFIPITENDADHSITATAGQTVFDFDFPILKNSQALIEQTPSGGSPSTLIEGTHYTLENVGDQNGFRMTLITPAILDDVLRARRSTPIVREVYYQKAGDFRAATVNQDIVTLVMIAQELLRTANEIVAGSIPVGSITNALIGNNEVQNGKLAQMPAHTIKGNDTGAAANPSDMTIAALAQMMQASTFDMRAGVSQDVLVTPANIANSLAWVVLNDEASITVDWQAGFNRTVTLGGNRTIENPINVQPGSSRFVEVAQDGVGSRTLTFESNYKFVGGAAPTLSTGPGEKDLLQFYARAANEIWVFFSGDLS